MKDPYEILGISRSATDEEVKKAYRAASRKYHPDANPQNPKAAEEKFKEVQQAYKEIVKERSEGASGAGGQGGSYGQSGRGYGGSGGQQSSSGGGYGEGPFWGWGFGGYGDFGGFGQTARPKAVSYESDPPKLKAAANYINEGYFQEALRILNDVRERNARWYYFSAMANAGAGNNVLAKQQIAQALSLDAGNGDYRVFEQYLNGNSEWYRTRQGSYGTPDFMGNDFCLKLCLANLLCNCCCSGGYYRC